MSSVYIGSARIGENGEATGGKDGDQRQTSKPDYKGEVSEQLYYIHKKGWDILRPVDPVEATALGDEMKAACSNANIGYDQDERYDVVRAVKTTKSLNKISEKVNSDCSSLVRACIIAAMGVDPGNFTTDKAKEILTKTKKFSHIGTIRSSADNPKLYKGDVLCTRTKGHIVIVTRASEQPKSPVKNKSAIKYYRACNKNEKSIVEGLNSIGVNSEFNNRKKIARLNGIISYNGSASDNASLLTLLKRGKLIKSKS